MPETGPTPEINPQPPSLNPEIPLSGTQETASQEQQAPLPATEQYQTEDVDGKIKAARDIIEEELGGQENRLRFSPESDDFYERLGVARGAGGDEIKKAYRMAARQFHPDRNPGDERAAASFRNISDAYEALSDKDGGATYDGSMPTPFTERDSQLGLAVGRLREAWESWQNRPIEPAPEYYQAFMNQSVGYIESQIQAVEALPALADAWAQLNSEAGLDIVVPGAYYDYFLRNQSLTMIQTDIEKVGLLKEINQELRKRGQALNKEYAHYFVANPGTAPIGTLERELEKLKG